MAKKKRPPEMQEAVDLFMKFLNEVMEEDFRRMRAGYETIAERSERLSRRDARGRWKKAES